MSTIAEQNLTIRETLSWAADYLCRFEVPDSRIEAEYLLSHVLGRRRTELFLNYQNQVSPDLLGIFIKYIERRIKREPSQYIIGEQEFRGLALKVNRDVLIPRPETELVVEEAVKTISDSKTTHPVILDLCTGSGCIAVSLAKEIPGSRIYAVDISEKALRVARGNAEIHKVAGRIIFLQGDLFEPLKGLKFDLIVSNPPYVAKQSASKLQPEVSDFEPEIALYGGDDGLEFYRRIIVESPGYLTDAGHIICEIGYGQKGSALKLFKASRQFQAIETIKDLAGIDRIIKASGIF